MTELGLSRTTVGRPPSTRSATRASSRRAGAPAASSASRRVRPGSPSRRPVSSPPTSHRRHRPHVCRPARPPPASPRPTSAPLTDLPRHLATAGYHPRGLPELRAGRGRLVRGSWPAHLTRPGRHHLRRPRRPVGGAAGRTSSVGDRVLLESPDLPECHCGSAALGLPRRAHPADRAGVGRRTHRARPASERRAGGIPHPRPPEPDRARHVHRRRGDRRATCCARTRPCPSSTRPSSSSGSTDRTRPAGGALRRPRPGSHTLGSAGKTWWGGLRVGWVRAPHGPAEPSSRRDTASTSARRCSSSSSLVDLLQPGRGSSTNGAREARSATRRDRRRPPASTCRTGASPCRPAASTCGASCRTTAATTLARVAESAGVRLARGSQFGIEGGLDRFVRIPFCVHPTRPTRSAAASPWHGGAPSAAGRRSCRALRSSPDRRTPRNPGLGPSCERTVVSEGW